MPLAKSNISAAMIELGLPYIRGYKPRGNYQAAPAGEIRRRVQDARVLAALRAAPAAAAAGGRLQPAPPPLPARRRGGRHIDYGLLQEENRKLGALGEQLVVAFERRQLSQGGWPRPFGPLETGTGRGRPAVPGPRGPYAYSGLARTPSISRVIETFSLTTTPPPGTGPL